MKSFILCSLLFFILPSSSFAEEIVIASSEKSHYAFINWTKETPCEKIDSFNSTHATRTSVEIVLICKALHIGGIYPRITFKYSPNYTRSLTLTASGLAAIHEQSVWKSNVNEDYFFVSDPIIQNTEFEKIFYPKKDVRDEIERELKKGHLVGISSLEILKRYKVVSSKNWTIDWKTLQGLGFELSSTTRYSLMFKMVHYNRVHLLLGEPSSKLDMSIVDREILLYPIRGVKVGLGASRHFVVSKKYPDSLRIYNALQKGVKKMRKNGTIKRAFDASGFFHPLLKDWEKL